MKLNRIATSTIVALTFTIFSTSCIGRFALFNKLRQWNETVGTKWTNELVFVAFWIIPVYEIAGLADLLVINSIEFWNGTNPVACGTRIIEGNDGVYTITTDHDGYTIVSHNDGSEIRLDFDQKAHAWDITSNGETIRLLTFIDDSHVDMITPDGTYRTIELSDQGLMAYRSICQDNLFMAYEKTTK